jgi:hypothetical protein
MEKLQQTKPLKEFKSATEVVNDLVFMDFVKKNIAELRTNRLNRPEPKPGHHYKRNWYDRIIETGNFNTDFFIKHIESIWNKESRLNSETRTVIKFVCDKALHETLMEYNKEDENKVHQKKEELLCDHYYARKDNGELMPCEFCGNVKDENN